MPKDETPGPSQDAPAGVVIRSPGSSLEPHSTSSDPVVIYDNERRLPGVSRATAASVLVLALLVLIAAIAVVPHFVSRGASGASSEPQLATVALSSFPVAATASGTVVPASQTPLGFVSRGTISEIDVHTGQAVVAGTVLAKLDDGSQQAAVTQAQGALASANALLADAQAPLTSTKSLTLRASLTGAQQTYAETVTAVQATAGEDAAVVAADQRAILTDQALAAAGGCGTPVNPGGTQCQSDGAALSAARGQLGVDQARATTDAADGAVRESTAAAAVTQASAAISAASTPDPTQVATAQTAVSNAQAQLQSAQAALGALQLVAPTAGSVLEIDGAVGEVVTDTASTAAATLPGTDAPVPPVPGDAAVTTGPSGLIVLGTPGQWVVGAAFPAAEAATLHPGQTGTLTATTLSGLSMPFHVLAVGQGSTPMDGTPSVWVSLSPDGDPALLSSGLVVTASITTGRADRVLAVPQSAVYTVGGVPHVDVWTGHRAVSTAVTTTQQGTELIEITSGLNAGQQVLMSAYDGLPGAVTPAP